MLCLSFSLFLSDPSSWDLVESLDFTYKIIAIVTWLYSDSILLCRGITYSMRKGMIHEWLCVISDVLASMPYIHDIWLSFWYNKIWFKLGSKYHNPMLMDLSIMLLQATNHLIVTKWKGNLECSLNLCENKIYICMMSTRKDHCDQESPTQN